MLYWRENWKAALYRAYRSWKLRGMEEGWKGTLTLDWFLSKPDLVVELLEGKYDSPSRGRPSGLNDLSGPFVRTPPTTEPVM